MYVFVVDVGKNCREGGNQMVQRELYLKQH